MRSPPADARRHATSRPERRVFPKNEIQRLLAADAKAEKAGYLLEFPSDRLIRKFFEETYVPIRLCQGSPRTIKSFRGTLNMFDKFCGCTATLDCLSDDLVERFMAWIVKHGNTPDTANKHRAEILAIWRYAWKKRKVEEAPRDVMRLQLPKQEPEAWSIEEFARIVEASRQEDEYCCDIPASKWWPAFLLTLYDTGLRFTAIRKLSKDALRGRLADRSPSDAKAQGRPEIPTASGYAQRHRRDGKQRPSSAVCLPVPGRSHPQALPQDRRPGRPSR
jgi:hypothetical protein